MKFAAIILFCFCAIAAQAMQITPSKPKINFPETALGGSRVDTVYFRSDTNITLHLYHFGDYGDPEKNFSISTVNDSLNLSDKRDGMLIVRFTPYSTGEKTDTIFLAQDGKLLLAIPISGAGVVKPDIINLEFERVIDFGKVFLSNTANGVLTLSSKSNIPVTVENFSAPPQQFTGIGATSSFDIDTGRSISIPLQFTPDKIGPFSYNLTFEVRGDVNTYSVLLSGEGIPSLDSVAIEFPRQIDFGKIFLLDTVERTITITSKSAKPIIVENFSSIGPEFSGVSSATLLNIAPDESVNIKLHFIPDKADTFSRNITFQVRGETKVYRIELTAEGIILPLPEIRVLLPDTTAEPGEEIFLPIKFSEPFDPKDFLRSQIDSFYARILVNPTILTPLSGRRDSIYDGWRVIEIRRPLLPLSNNILDTIGLFVGLGNSESTLLLLEELNWLSHGNIIAKAQTKNGRLGIKEIFSFGGKPRLLLGTELEMEFGADPAKNSTELIIKKTLPGTKLKVYNIQGGLVLDLTDKIPEKQLTISHNMFPVAGAYYFCLSAGKNSLTRLLYVE